MGITGQLVSIDEGDRTERIVIGLGADRSDVRVRVQVYEVPPSGRSPSTRSRSTLFGQLGWGLGGCAGASPCIRPSLVRKETGRSCLWHGDAASRRLSTGREETER